MDSEHARRPRTRRGPQEMARVFFKGCNAVLDHPGSSSRASREAVVRSVVPFGKGTALPARRALRPTASQLAELMNTTLLNHKQRKRQ